LQWYAPVSMLADGSIEQYLPLDGVPRIQMQTHCVELPKKTKTRRWVLQYG
jgi:hypothetical protein